MRRYRRRWSWYSWQPLIFIFIFEWYLVTITEIFNHRIGIFHFLQYYRYLRPINDVVYNGPFKNYVPNAWELGRIIQVLEEGPKELA